MSYVRLGKDSDVYVYVGGRRGYFNIIHKHNLNLDDLFFEERTQLLSYLKNINKLGLKVPKYCFDRLEKELKGK